MKYKWLLIRQLDQQLKAWKDVAAKYSPPRKGWIKTLRNALNMTAGQLAERMGLSRARIVQLEDAEIHGAVTLRSLKEAANALECELIYAIVPKGSHTLETIVKNQAKKVADERISHVAHSMALEDQALVKDATQIQKEELTKNLIEHLNKQLWSLPPKNEIVPKQTKKTRAKMDKHKKLINTLKKKSK